MRETKAWSQNLGHEKPMTTWTSYGQIDDHETGEILAGLSKQRQTDPARNIPPEVSAWVKQMTAAAGE